MARAIHKLTDRECRAAKPGRHGDGGSLYLLVSPAGARSWVFMYPKNGKRRELGLGAYPAIGLARAREKAAAMRTAQAEGIDPEQARDQQKGKATLGECADRVLQDLSPGWTNAKHAQQWRRSLTVEAAALRDVPVDKIDTEAVLQVLRPLWLAKAETASRLRTRIERTLDYAAAHGYRGRDNPARWRGQLRDLLPRQTIQRQHHVALPYDEIPALMQRLQAMDSLGARALAFTVLTACRTKEVLGARWSEIDLAAKFWTVPASRMKSRREHRVPLSDAAIALLQGLWEWRTSSDLVFPGHRRGQPINGKAMQLVLCALSVPAVPHGFRSSFRDWAGDANFASETYEMALAHAVGSLTERSYRRGDAYEQRRRLMESWGAYCTASDAGNVVTLRR
jgi:integrase